MRANGSSSRPRPGSSRSTTRRPTRSTAATRCPPSTSRCSPTATTCGTRRHRGVEAARVARELPALVEAFRTGSAPEPIPWEPDGRAEFNRALFLNLLGTRWLPAIPEVHARLDATPPAHVADIACGTGWSSIAMALAYPSIRVRGADLDERAIEWRAANAAEAGVADRVRFDVVDAAELAASGPYDLVTIFEALHDMVYPVDVLRAAREMLGAGGSVVVADERVSETFAAPASDRDRYVHAFSVLSRACRPRWDTTGVADHRRGDPAVDRAPLRR